MKKTLSAGLVLALILSSCAKDGYFMYEGTFYSETASMQGQNPDNQESGDSFDTINENPFIKVADNPVSTFSVDADGACYAYMRAYLKGWNRLPSKNSVRIEEYLNYFTFDYADPTGDETVAINAEIGDCPWNTGHMILRLGLKGKSMPDNEIPDANFILLIDTSGSMLGDDRIELIKKGVCNMLDYMKPTDRIALITYSGKVEKVLESTLVSDKAIIKRAINSLVASGGTAGGPAMKMAYDEAVAHYVKGGNNRIILCTDGDFNVGVSSTEALTEMVESYLDKGIYLSIMGFGMGNFQDSRMEQLSNHGNGTYNYIDSEEEMMKVFVNERSRFFSVANDTKCQVTFSPAVESYRLIGYENRVMSKEDFENDKKDAGEIGAGQTITALYELIPSQEYAAEAKVASFDVRYKKALGEQSRPLGLEVTATTGAPSSEFSFACGVAAYGLVLLESEYKGSSSFDLAKQLVTPGLAFDHDGLRAQFSELITLASKAGR